MTSFIVIGELAKNSVTWQISLAKPRQIFAETVVINRLSTENSG
jgi:hypothetical protein|uniref:Uncharacterized protein n=1 Tax=Myoviridae sp. ctqfO1 TaxID=2827710 RepID=A0A8S5T3B5_9CAUD|nr:MAG TPA: hypothetical protein [Myoviridae sp. ctqfO1]